MYVSIQSYDSASMLNDLSSFFGVMIHLLLLGVGFPILTFCWHLNLKTMGYGFPNLVITMKLGHCSGGYVSHFLLAHTCNKSEFELVGMWNIALQLSIFPFFTYYWKVYW